MAPATRPARQGDATAGQAERLVGEPPAAVTADRRVLDAEAVAQLERLGEVACGDLDLVTVGAHRLDQRAHDQHVGTVGQVDPDAHAATTSRIWSSVSSGPIGSARWVRATSSVPGSSRPGGAKWAVAGWRWIGTR